MFHRNRNVGWRSTECESCTRQWLEQRVELHTTATWQLGLKRASSSSLFHSACCPTSVMLLHTIPLVPFQLPTPFQPRFANSLNWWFLRKGGRKGRAPSLSFLEIKASQSFQLFFSIISNSLFLS